MECSELAARWDVRGRSDYVLSLKALRREAAVAAARTAAAAAVGSADAAPPPTDAADLMMHLLSLGELPSRSQMHIAG